MKTKLHRHIFYFFTFLILVSCNNVKDLQPAGGEDVPDGVAQVLTNAYPRAKDITLKTVLKDKLWEARFSSDNVLFYVALSTNRVLRAYKLLSPTVPDSLQNTFSTLSIKGGTFSDFRQEDFAVDTRYYTAKYVLNGTPYVVKWETYSQEGTYAGKHIYVVTVKPYFKFEYRIGYNEPELQTVVPAAINKYVATLNRTLTGATGYVSDENKVSYFISATDFMPNIQINLFYDESNNLAIEYPGPGDQVFLGLPSFPEQVIKFVDNSVFTSKMSFGQGYIKKTEAIAQFGLFFNREISQQFSNTEAFQVWLDRNGNLVDFLYTASLFV
ncbi:hypothetical protein [Dyadobacter sp. CY356]|uniref:hypothetical protein n=1 Tax=Dyadobacter sp. CY356 TaxID=2906442 RepID=UPI001F3D6B1A|nr:hypothetical protein [Dyadobacter sp. CY356]MCF0056282.1 hypothetical protein [Dyadobacter sp. CY356]